MLTEEQREIIVNRIKDLDFTYNDEWDVDPKIYRGGGSFDKKHPSIVVDFYPTNRPKFRSVSHAIGKIEGTDYVEYGYCQLEQCVIRCRCHEHHKNREYNGRNVIDFLSRKILTDIMREWDSILKGMNNACLDKLDIPYPRDVSIYNANSGNWIFIYELSFFIRTQFRWNYKPEEVEINLAEKIGYNSKSINENEYEYNFVESD